MNKREIVQALMDSVRQVDFENAKSMLAEDFQYSGPVPEPINAEAWLGISISLKTAFPDLNYHFKVIGTEGDVVRAISQLSGTHSGSFSSMRGAIHEWSRQLADRYPAQFPRGSGTSS